MFRVDPAAIHDEMRRDYHRRLAEYLRRNTADLVAPLSDAQLESDVALAVGRGQSYGIRTKEGLLAFVILALMAGNQFADDPAIQKLFAELDPETAIRRLAVEIENEFREVDRAAFSDGEEV